MKRKKKDLDEELENEGSIYSEHFVEELEEDDEISPEEQGFMEGYLEA